MRLYFFICLIYIVPYKINSMEPSKSEIFDPATLGTLPTGSMQPIIEHIFKDKPIIDILDNYRILRTSKHFLKFKKIIDGYIEKIGWDNINQEALNLAIQTLQLKYQNDLQFVRRNLKSELENRLMELSQGKTIDETGMKNLESRFEQLTNLQKSPNEPTNISDLKRRFIMIIKFLISKNKLDINITDNQKNNLLMICAALNLPIIAQYLIDKIDLEATNIVGETAFTIAVKNNSPEMLKVLLLGAKINPNIKINLPDHNGQTPFMHASKTNLKLVQLLINYITSLEEHDLQGDTALFIALKSKHFEIAKYLIEKGADLDAYNSSLATPREFMIKNNIDLTSKPRSCSVM
ncbi:ankyrin repeat domain-containing protein [Candidatus Dependentiae bacterium]|nr:ankyrin repeat domain-containing protein [Candidatus Dependentiae bacterium]